MPAPRKNDNDRSSCRHTLVDGFLHCCTHKWAVLCVVFIGIFSLIGPLNTYPYYSLNLPLNDNLCPNMFRIGGAGDGGKNLCDASTITTSAEQCVVYSFGVNYVFGFDQDLSNRGCQVHGFDPSPAGLSSQQSYQQFGGHYHNYGLGSMDKVYPPHQVPFRWPGMDYLQDTNSDAWNLKRLPTIMQENNHEKVTILKVDVEGAEWDTMLDIANADWDELYLELHFPPGEYSLAKDWKGGLTVSRKRALFTLLRKRPALNVSEKIDRIGLLQLLLQVGDLYYWEFNPGTRLCVEVAFKRKDNLGKNIDWKVLRAPSPIHKLD